MINGQCPTWFVVKWLEKHTMHRAKAPKTQSFPACEAAACGTLYVNMSGWQRSDWTIYNERGKRVRFKRRKPTMTVPPYGTLTMRSRIRIGEVLKALDKPLDVFVRERRS